MRRSPLLSARIIAQPARVTADIAYYPLRAPSAEELLEADCIIGARDHTDSREGQGRSMPMFGLRAALAVSALLSAMPRALAEDALAERGRAVRLLRFLSLSWSTVLLRGGRRAGNLRGQTLQCGARPYSFVVHGLWPQYEKRISRILPSPGATIVPRHRFFHAQGSDAGAASGLQRVGQAQELAGPCASRLFRYRAQSARNGENPV